VKWFVRKNHNQRLFQEQKLCGWMNDMILISNVQISWKIGWNSILILLLNSKKASLIYLCDPAYSPFSFLHIKNKNNMTLWGLSLQENCFGASA
jgi:hypothetical protein